MTRFCGTCGEPVFAHSRVPVPPVTQLEMMNKDPKTFSRLNIWQTKALFRYMARACPVALVDGTDDPSTVPVFRLKRRASA